jgi:hypothetical protein
MHSLLSNFRTFVVLLKDDKQKRVRCENGNSQSPNNSYYQHFVNTRKLCKLGPHVLLRSYCLSVSLYIYRCGRNNSHIIL